MPISSFHTAYTPIPSLKLNSESRKPAAKPNNYTGLPTGIFKTETTLSSSKSLITQKAAQYQTSHFKSDIHVGPEIPRYSQLRSMLLSWRSYYQRLIDRETDAYIIENLEQECRKKLHQVLAIPAHRRTAIHLDYSGTKGKPFRYKEDLNFELDKLLRTLLSKRAGAKISVKANKILKELEADYKDAHKKKGVLDYTHSLKFTKQTLKKVHTLLKEFTENDWEIWSPLKSFQNGLNLIITYHDPAQRPTLFKAPSYYEEQLNFFCSLVPSDLLPPFSLKVSLLPPNSYVTPDEKDTVNLYEFYDDKKNSVELVHELIHQLEMRNRLFAQKNIQYIKTHSTKVTSSKTEDVYQSNWKEYGSLTITKNSAGIEDGTEGFLSKIIEKLYLWPQDLLDENEALFGYLVDRLHGY